MNNENVQQQAWPDLKYDLLADTITTVQLWAQIVGKIRLASSPWLNHSWHVTLYVSPTGLTTGSIPFPGGLFELAFDFHRHQLIITTSEGAVEEVSLYPRTVASFYDEVFTKLAQAGIRVQIHARPNEIDPAIPFAQDDVHQWYDKEQMNLYWKALVRIAPVFSSFRARFTGKCSPVHLFWGGFDLAVTRFSGKQAPTHPGGMPNMPLRVMQESYSHEVSSAGFWPGSKDFPQPAFYSYCYPTPAAFGQQKVAPGQAFYSQEMGEFFLTYDTVRQAANPEEEVLQFLETTYQAAATTGNWDTEALAFKYIP